MPALTDDAIDTAQEIAEREPRPTTWPEHLERAREIVRTVGDLPEVTMFEMIMRAPADAGDVLAQLEALRPDGAVDRPAREPRE
jgi:hypothetical protein